MITLPYDISCGYCDCSEFGNLSVSPKRKTEKFEIEFYLENGESTYTNDNEYIIKKHHIQIAKPNQVRYSKLPFKTMFLKFKADEELAKLLTNAPEYFICSHPQKISEKLEEIILLNESGDNQLLLYSRLLSFINLVLYDSEIPKLQSGQNYEIITNAKRYMESNYKEDIYLKDIANAVNLSPIYFHNIFTSACGISPHNYLINCRIAEAKKLLWNSTIPLTLIAENCGFGCQQHFNKVFKKQTGTTPGRYRKEIQQNYLEDWL